MSDEYEACPECACARGGGWTRSDAFDAYFGGRSRELPQRKVVRSGVAGTDPTAWAELACGHTVMA